LAAPHSGEVVSVAGGAAAALSVLFAVKSAAAGGIEQQVSNGASHPVRALLAAGPPCLGFRAVGAGFAKPVGTGPVRPVPGGSGPTRYMNRSGSHPEPCLKFLTHSEPSGLTSLPARFLNRGNRPSHRSVNPARRDGRNRVGRGGSSPPYGAPACRAPPQIVLMYIQLGGAEKNTQTYFCILGQLICFYLLRPNKEQPTKMKTLFLS
jgi:hypothetical protein